MQNSEVIALRTLIEEGRHVSSAPSRRGEKVHRVNVIYTPDSVQSIHAADLFQQFADLYAKDAGTVWYDFVIMPVTTAIIKKLDKDDIFVWLGLKEEISIIPGIKPRAFKKLHHILLTETSDAMNEFSRKVKPIQEIFAAHNGDYGVGAHLHKSSRDNIHVLQYGMVLEVLGVLAYRFSMASDFPTMVEEDFVNYVIERQQTASRFEMTMAGCDPEGRIQIIKSFEATVRALRRLNQPGGMIDLTDPIVAYEKIVKHVRHQLNTTGHLETSRYHQKSIRAYFTQIPDFYWVARRLIKMVHHYYVNATLCQTGVLMTSNVPSDYGVIVNTNLIRSR